VLQVESDDAEARCRRVERDQAGDCRGSLAPLGWAATAAVDEALIRVAAAGFIYKGAICCACHPRVMRVSPLVPGIDVAGTLLVPVAGLIPLGAAGPLAALGAARVVMPAEIGAPSPTSLVSGRWAGVGMAGGAELATTVHPFILRGVTLAGIDAATQPSQADRRRLWARLADLWPIVRGHLPVTELRLDEVGDHAARMLRGDSIGRAVVFP
jgi:hypothetical protein